MRFTLKTMVILLVVLFSLQVKIALGQDVQKAGINIQSGGTVSGVVYDDRGNLLANADVGLEYYESGDWVLGTQTDGNGGYTFEGLADGRYRIRAEAPGYVQKYYNNTLSRDDAAPLDIAAGQAIQDINFVLESGGTVSGTVSDGQDNPLAGISLNSWRHDGYPQGTVTREDGTFTIIGLPFGNYKVSARDGWGPSDGAWARAWYCGKTQDNQADLVTISFDNPNAHGVDFVLSQGGSITGAVTDEQGAPLAGAHVYANYWDGGGAAGWTITDNNGNYVLSGLSGGEYQIIVEDSGRVRKYYPDTPVHDQASPLQVTAGQVTAGINFTLESAGTISGAVTDSQGDPLAGISVSCGLVGGLDGWGAETGADGTYTVTGLPFGEYRVHAVSGWGTNDGIWVRKWYNGKEDQNSADLVALSAAVPNAEGINFLLERAGSISGTVIDQSAGGPPEDAATGSVELAEGWHKIVYRFEECEGGSVARAGFKAPGDAEWRIFSTSELTVRTAPAPDAGQGILLTTGKNNSGFPLNHGQMLACVDLESTQDAGWYGQSVVQEIYQQENIHGWSDYFTARYEAYFYVSDSLAGAWRFSTDSDDASEIMIDDRVVAYWYNGHGSAGGWEGKGRVSAVRVTGVDSEGNRQFGTSYDAFVSSDGSYIVENIQPGVYAVHTDIPGYPNQVYNGVYRPFANPDSITLIEVVAGEDKSGTNFAVNRGGGIAGRVLDAGGDPVPWANVAVYFNINGCFLTNDYFTTRADSSGNYSLFGNLISGDYKVRAWEAGTGMKESGPVVLTAPQITGDIDLVLENIGAISGVVRDEQGDPLAGARIWAEYLSGHDAAGGTETDREGAYTILGLAPGQYRVAAGAAGRVTRFYDNTLIYDQAGTVSVTTGQVTAEIDFALEPGGTISGTVTDEQSNPLASVSVNCDSIDQSYGNGEKTGAGGLYTITGLPFGTYKVYSPAYGRWAENDGNWAQEWYSQKAGWDQADTVTISEASPDAAGVDFTLEQGGTTGTDLTRAELAKILAEKLGLPLYLPENPTFSDVPLDYWAAGYIYSVAKEGILSGFEDGTFRPELNPIRARFAELLYRTFNVPEYIPESPTYSDVLPDHYAYEAIESLTRAGIVSGYPDGTFRPEDTVTESDATILFERITSGGITGRVTDEQGNPLAGVHVWAEYYEDGGGLSGDLTDEEGNYTIWCVSPGQYRVTARVGGRVKKFYNNTLIYDQAEPVEVTAGQTSGGIDFTLEPGGTILGTVTDDQGSPLEGVSVQCRSVDELYGDGAETGSDGSYTITGLPFGTYKVFSPAGGRWGENDDNWAQGWHSQKAGWDQADPVTISAASPDAAGIDFTLEQGGTISGIVTDGQGNLLAGADVWVDYYEGEDWAGGAQTDENGAFAIQGLAAGQYRVGAEVTGQVKKYYNNTLFYDQAAPVIVTAGQTTSGINFTLEPAGTVSGVVYDDKGGPLAGISINCVLSDGSCGWGAETGSDGTYTVTHLPFGSYKVNAPYGWGSNDSNWVKIWYNGKTLWDQADPVTISVANPNAAGVNFTLEQGGTISGTVTDEQGIPLAGARVYAKYWSDGSRDVLTSTDANGNYILSGLPGGEYRVIAVTTGRVVKFYQDAFSMNNAAPVLVIAGQDTPDVNFALEPAGTVTGLVLDNLGNLLADVRVDLIDSDGNYYPNSFSNSSGVFNRENIYPGTYTLRFFSTQHKYLVKRIPGVSITAGETTDVGTVILIAGDANGDNRISLFDLVLLAKSYDKTQGQQGYNGNCDFNGDGAVDFRDLLVLANSYDLSGD